MSKKVIFFLIIITVCNKFILSQTGGELVKIHSFTNLTEINNIATPSQGSFAYRTDNGTMYYYNGNEWLELNTEGYGDAWGVDNEDITSYVYRNGNVGIGISSPSEKLDVNGSVRIRKDVIINGVASNDAAFNAGTSTSIDFSQSNMAYTTANTNNTFILNNLKDGATYSLAVQGLISGTATFISPGYNFRSNTNGQSIANTHTLYTFLVIGNVVYFTMSPGI
jgi:hypothetical protein